jgi:SAM-dependent methyltransferase
MIKEYWDDVDREQSPVEEGEDPSNLLVERPALARILPKDLTNTTTLAVGCEDSEPALEVARRGGKVVAVDPSEEALDVFFQAFARERLNTDLVVAEPDVLKPIPDETIDLVTTGPIVNDVYNLEPLFAEFHRVLRPHGAVLMVIPHPLVSGGHSITGGTGKSQWILDDYFSPAKLTNPHTLEDFINTALEAGFVIERVMEPKPDPRKKGVNNASWNLYNRFPQLMVMVARKPD